MRPVVSAFRATARAHHLTARQPAQRNTTMAAAITKTRPAELEAAQGREALLCTDAAAAAPGGRA
jgi:hypothetical protein